MKIKLSVYDILGRELAILFEGEQEQGNHEAVFNGEQFSSGVYIVRLTGTDKSNERKILLMK